MQSPPRPPHRKSPWCSQLWLVQRQNYESVLTINKICVNTFKVMTFTCCLLWKCAVYAQCVIIFKRTTANVIRRVGFGYQPWDMAVDQSALRIQVCFNKDKDNVFYVTLNFNKFFVVDKGDNYSQVGFKDRFPTILSNTLIWKSRYDICNKPDIK